MITIVLTPILKEWTFIPLAFVYWGTTIAIVLKTVGFQRIKEMFEKPTGKKMEYTCSICRINTFVNIVNEFIFTET